AYDAPTRTATWTLGRAIGSDRVVLRLRSDAGADANTGVSAGGEPLDGEWADGADAYPSGDGTAGGDFAFRVNVLPGDVNRDGVVNAQDLGRVRARQQTRAGSSAAATAVDYGAFEDVNGDGRINVL